MFWLRNKKIIFVPHYYIYLSNKEILSLACTGLQSGHPSVKTNKYLWENYKPLFIVPTWKKPLIYICVTCKYQPHHEWRASIYMPANGTVKGSSHCAWHKVGPGYALYSFVTTAPPPTCSPLVKRAYQIFFFLFLNQNICCGYSKEPSQWDGSFEHPKYMLKLMGKKIITIVRWQFFFIWEDGRFCTVTAGTIQWSLPLFFCITTVPCGYF